MAQSILRHSAAASPRTRGWTPIVQGRGGPAAGFPAHAGMDPDHAPPPGRGSRLPRARGDGPGVEPPADRQVQASPRTRGWTFEVAGRDVPSGGFPAHAGMDPFARHAGRMRSRLPRARGDGPQTVRRAASVALASPRTRGWTRHRPDVSCGVCGFPAHAGMDPRRRAQSRNSRRLPRARGDGPYLYNR